jgi:hypothetical protein
MSKIVQRLIWEQIYTKKLAIHVDNHKFRPYTLHNRCVAGYRNIEAKLKVLLCTGSQRITEMFPNNAAVAL